MNAQEQLILDVVVKISTGHLGRKQGQQVLGVSERTLRRYLGEYVRRGPLFVKHGNSGRAPLNKNEQALKLSVQALMRDQYFDFNVSHAREKLKQSHGIEISHDTLLRWCHEIQLVKRAKHRRRAKVRRRRDRMAQTGVMLQMDGSPHHWFGNKPSCLIAAIDDADGDVPYGEFFPAEDTLSCLRVLRQIVEKKGLFQILYVDRAGIFGGQKRANFSQVKRALGELGIHVIFAQSPEAKGRIERLWGTLQDRLIPEMRLRKIRSYDNANCFLQEQFLPNEYAQRFKVTPENLASAYRPVPEGADLREVFCLKEFRTCARDHTFQWNGRTYLIESELKHSIYKQKIEIRTYPDLTWRAFFAGKLIGITETKRKSLAAKAPDSTPPAVISQIHAIKVRMDGHVTYQGRHYSVDEKYVAQKVSVLEKEGKLQIYCQGELIETHEVNRSPHSLCSTKPEHLSPWKRALDVDSGYRKAARHLGNHVDELVLLILERGQGFIDTATIWGVLNHEKNFPPQAINEACKLAIELESPTYKAVTILLKLHRTRWQAKKPA